MADSLSNFDYIMCQHITIGGQFCPFWCSDKKIGNTLNSFDHINSCVMFLSTKTVCVSFNDLWNSFAQSSFVLAPPDPQKTLFQFPYFYSLPLYNALWYIQWSGPNLRSLKALRVYTKVIRRMVTPPNPAANYYVSTMSWNAAATMQRRQWEHSFHASLILCLHL